MIYGLVATNKAEKRKVNVGDAWFRVSPPSLFCRAGVSILLVLSAFFDLLRCREICLLYRFSLLIGSNSVFFGVFLPRKSRIGRKITFIFIF